MVILNKVKISIIIPAYNVEGYIEDALESVLKQSVEPYEIIIVNDGSTDGTGKIINQYGDNALIKIINQNNMGLGEARNSGITHAEGDYLYFFDSDDRLTPDFIKSISEQIVSYSEPDVVFFSGEAFYDEGFSQTKRDVSSLYKRHVVGVYTKGENSDNSVVRDLVNTQSFHAGANLYVSKRVLWTEHNLRFKSIIHEDEEIIFPLLYSANKVAVVDDVYYLRRFRNDSIMTSAVTENRVNGYRVVIQSLLRFIKDNKADLSDDLDILLSRLNMFVGMYLDMSRKINASIDYGLLLRLFPLTYSRSYLYSMMKLLVSYHLCRYISPKQSFCER